MKGLVWILVIAVIAIVGYLGYTQGYFTGADEAEGDGLEINLGTTN